MEIFRIIIGIVVLFNVFPTIVGFAEAANNNSFAEGYIIGVVLQSFGAVILGAVAFGIHLITIC